MPIEIGSPIPAAKLKMKVGDQVSDVSTDEYFAGKKVVLFGVPGAFTPTCSNNHLPGYLTHLDAIKAKGVDKVAVIATNDHHVMGAWAAATGGAGKIDYLADGNATFVKAMGLDNDSTAGGMGIRAKRFAAVIENGVVKALNIEDMPGKVTSSGADALLMEL